MMVSLVMGHHANLPTNAVIVVAFISQYCVGTTTSTYQKHVLIY